MRKALKHRDGDRFRVRATVERFGTKRGFRGEAIPTLLLKHLRDATTGQILSDHLWFTQGKWSDGLKAGDMIEFDARVGSYEKGYKGHRDDVVGAPVKQDWKLQRPTDKSPEDSICLTASRHPALTPACIPSMLAAGAATHPAA